MSTVKICEKGGFTEQQQPRLERLSTSVMRQPLTLLERSYKTDEKHIPVLQVGNGTLHELAEDDNAALGLLC